MSPRKEPDGPSPSDPRGGGSALQHSRSPRWACRPCLEAQVPGGSFLGPQMPQPVTASARMPSADLCRAARFHSPQWAVPAPGSSSAAASSARASVSCAIRRSS